MSTQNSEPFQIVRDELTEALNSWYKDDLKNPAYRSFTEGAIQQLLPGIDDIERAHRDVQYIQQGLYALEGIRGVLHYVKRLRALMITHERTLNRLKNEEELRGVYEKQMLSLRGQIDELKRSCVPQSRLAEFESQKDEEIENLKKQLATFKNEAEMALSREELANEKLDLAAKNQMLLNHKFNALFAENEQTRAELAELKGQVEDASQSQSTPMPKAV